MSKKHVLVVDDEAPLRELVREILELTGFSVVEAENGQVAQTLLAAEKFDAIISDIRMPLVDGIELLRFVRSSNPIPFILMTGFSEILETQSAFSLGATDFIAKPFKSKELLAMLNRCLESKPENENKRNLDSDYYRISMESCGSGISLISDIYIKFSSFKYLKIAHKGTQIDTSRVQAYKQRGVDFLYIRVEDYVQADKVEDKPDSVQIHKKIKWK